MASSAGVSRRLSRLTGSGSAGDFGFESSSGVFLKKEKVGRISQLDSERVLAQSVGWMGHGKREEGD